MVPQNTLHRLIDQTLVCSPVADVGAEDAVTQGFSHSCYVRLQPGFDAGLDVGAHTSTTVVDRVLSWFPTHAGGGHHGSVAAAGFLSRQCDPGDGTYVGAVADGGGATDWAPIRPT